MKKTVNNKKATASLQQKKNARKDLSYLWLLLALFAGFVALAPILKNEFINYDDDIYVTNNPFIQNFGIEKMKYLFTHYYLNQYSPVSMCVMGIEFKISSNPVFIKLVSVLLHLLVTFVLYKLLKLLFDKAEYVLIPTVIFALHPIQVESIAWTTAAMKIGVFTLFFLGSLFYYVKYIEQEKKTYLIFSHLLFILSLLSKEQALVLPVILLLIDYFKSRNLLDKKIWLEKVMFFLLAIIFGIITLKSSSGGNQSVIVSYSLVDRFIISNFTIIDSFIKALFPFKLSVFYTFPIKDHIPVIYYVLIVCFPALIYAIFLAVKKNNRIIAFALLFFLINLGLPILSQFLGSRDVMMADRYMYIPIIGFAILLVYLMLYFKKRFNFSETTFYTIFIIYFLALSVGTYNRSKVWKDSVALFSDAIEKGKNSEGKYSPFLSLAFNNRGIALKKQKKYDLAETDFKMAMDINPSDVRSYVNRGNINFEKQNLQVAIADYDKALAINDNNAPAHSSRGCSYAMLGNFESALKDLNRALEIDSTIMDSYLNRSLVFYSTKKYTEALRDINKYLSVNTTDFVTYGQRGLIHLNMGNLNDALKDMTFAIDNLQDSGLHYLNRSLVYKELANKPLALKDALKAKEMGMNVGEEYINSLK